MTLKEIIEKIKKPVQGQFDDNINVEALCYSVGLNDFKYYSEQTRLKAFYYQRWLCTDTYVGRKVYFLDDEAVATSWQPARKSSEDISFISEETFKKVQNFVVETYSNEPEVSKIPLTDLNEEVGEFYQVQYAEQLLEKYVYIFENGVKIPVKALKAVTGEGSKYVKEFVEIEFETGETKVVNIKEIFIQYLIN